MSIIRVFHNRGNPFGQLNKKALQDNSLSLKAKGLWAMCLNCSDDWDFQIKELSHTLKEGKDAIYAAINELIEHRYCYSHQLKNDQTGRFQKHEYIFFEFKMSLEELEEFKKSLPLERSG